MNTHTCTTRLLEDGISILDGLDENLYVRSAAPLFESTIGAHWRHCLEHYQLLLAGLPDGRIDYTARVRDQRLETDRTVGVDAARDVLARIRAVPVDDAGRSLEVKLETGGDTDEWAATSLARELDALLGHTVHHYAIIAAILRHHGCPADRTFGIAPSTLRYEMDASTCAQ